MTTQPIRWCSLLWRRPFVRQRAPRMTRDLWEQGGRQPVMIRAGSDVPPEYLQYAADAVRDYLGPMFGDKGRR